MNILSEYQKNKEYLVCVDSDGCAMDTMDIKHYRCFGPCMIDEWELGGRREELLARWNDINLYTMTRGINRFKALAIALSEVSESGTAVDGIGELVNWAENSPELSNASLERAIAQKPDAEALKKALSWSYAVNRAITELPEDEVGPFPGAHEALEYAHRYADVAIVSSANPDAVLAEWEKHGLLEHTDIVLAQNAGSKAACIEALLKKGYRRENAVMCGDAPGDLAAAEKNRVNFFPILVRRERESWQEFMDTALLKLTGGTYAGEYGNKKTEEFIDNLKK